MPLPSFDLQYSKYIIYFIISKVVLSDWDQFLVFSILFFSFHFIGNLEQASRWSFATRVERLTVRTWPFPSLMNSIKKEHGALPCRSFKTPKIGNPRTQSWEPSIDFGAERPQLETGLSRPEICSPPEYFGVKNGSHQTSVQFRTSIPHLMLAQCIGNCRLWFLYSQKMFAITFTSILKVLR